MKVVDYRGGLALEDRWDLLHRHALGKAGSAFVEGLERGVLVAARCDACARVLLPPRVFCERCFRPVELLEFEGRSGELLTFTVVRRAFTGSPPVPYAIGYVRLDGVDTALGALIDGVDPDEAQRVLRVGMRAELVVGETGFGIERVRIRPER